METYDVDSGGVFGAIIGDMKQMSPILEEFLGKASKFYAAVRSSASAADSFLDAFQKLADATTSSKGSTKDLGVSFTKLVMRHKSIENKLKTFLGVFTDNFIWPLQEKMEEYKKTTSQLEKDHSKDLKRAKSDTKKAASEVVKLRKKMSKKGRQEHQEQYLQAVKVAEAHCTSLEEQERHYLRRLMIEERSRMCHFFNCYRPVVEQELTLVSEIENLQSILEETVKQCRNPNQLPLIADDVIRQYRAPERALLPKDSQNPHQPSPPGTPITRERAHTTSSVSSLASSTQSLSPNHHAPQQPSGTMTLNRHRPIQSASGYGTLRKSGPPPKPVDLPLPGSLSSQSSSVSSSEEMRGRSESMSPVFPSPPGPDDDTPIAPRHAQLNGNHFPNNGVDHSPVDEIDSNGKFPPPKSSPNKMSSRSSWSSTETSDSSGIGSYNSLTAPGRNAGNNNNDPQQMVKDFLSGNSLEALETHLIGCEDIYSRMTYGSSKSPVESPRDAVNQPEGTFSRNAFKSSSLRGTNTAMMNTRSMLRSNSIQNGNDHAQLSHEMKLNFQRGRNNTIAGRPSAGGVGRTSIFQVFNEQTSSTTAGPHAHAKSSPVRWAKPPPPTRSVSYHGNRGEPHYDTLPLRKSSAPTNHEPRFEESEEIPDPGSFLAQIKQKRQVIRTQSVIEADEGATML